MKYGTILILKGCRKVEYFCTSTENQFWGNLIKDDGIHRCYEFHLSDVIRVFERRKSHVKS